MAAAATALLPEAICAAHDGEPRLFVAILEFARERSPLVNVVVASAERLAAVIGEKRGPTTPQTPPAPTSESQVN